MRLFRSVLASRVALFAALPVLGAGCMSDRYEPQGALSIPTTGKVRVVSTKIKQTPRELHWKWTLIGERNWVKPEATETGASLVETYPSNAVERHDGTNIWEVDLIAERDDKNLKWTNRIHGINGETRKATGTIPLPPGSAENAVQIELDRDSVEGLPADVTLARVGDKTITLKVAR